MSKKRAGKTTGADNPETSLASHAAIDMPVRLNVRVTPRSSRNGLIKYDEDCAHIRVSAPPVDSAANAACCELLAELAGVRASQVSVVGGAHSRSKVVSIAGITAEDLKARLAKASAS